MINIFDKIMNKKIDFSKYSTKNPVYIYLGKEEYKLLIKTYKNLNNHYYNNMYSLNNSVFGLKIIRVKEKTHLMVG